MQKISAKTKLPGQKWERRTRKIGDVREMRDTLMVMFRLGNHDNMLLTNQKLLWSQVQAMRTLSAQLGEKVPEDVARKILELRRRINENEKAKKKK